MKIKRDKAVDVIIGANVRKLREAKKIRLLDMALDIDATESDLSRKERGERPFSDSDIKAICQYFKKDYSYFTTKSESSQERTKRLATASKKLAAIRNSVSVEEWQELIANL